MEMKNKENENRWKRKAADTKKKKSECLIKCDVYVLIMCSEPLCAIKKAISMLLLGIVFRCSPAVVCQGILVVWCWQY